MLSGRMAPPRSPDKFVPARCDDLEVFIERELLEEGQGIEFLIPHEGYFTIQIAGDDAGTATKPAGR